MWLGQTLVILKRVMYAHQIHGFNPLMDFKVLAGDRQMAKRAGRVVNWEVASSIQLTPKNRHGPACNVKV